MIGIGPSVLTLLMFVFWGVIIYVVYTIVNRLGRIARSLEKIEDKLGCSGENTSPPDPLSHTEADSSERVS